jgi:hypothetical protein
MGLLVYLQIVLEIKPTHLLYVIDNGLIGCWIALLRDDQGEAAIRQGELNATAGGLAKRGHPIEIHNIGIPFIG